MPSRVMEIYEARLARHEIEPDPAQADVVRALDDLAGRLAPETNSRALRLPFLRSPRRPPPRGLYIHGSVGRGKTMLMDLFFEGVDVARKRRVHFHAFMAETHERIARGRATTDGDPIPFVAADIAGEAALLCFDEFHVTDIADAMILGRLFKSLLDRGVVVVATSNAAPDRLYWNGLNRQLFLPFIALLEERLDVIELQAARDFRLDKLAGRQLYFVPADEAAGLQLEAHWDRLTGRQGGQAMTIDVKGRALRVPRAAAGVAWFGFSDLCGAPLGAGDYLEIARTFHTVLITEIPIMMPEQRNEARRFITLIDTLYDRGTCLIASSAAEPDELYRSGDGADLFERTASRLQEMRSEAYLAGLNRQVGGNSTG